MKIQITDLFSGLVLFEHEAERNTVALTLVAAVKARVNLTDAKLDGASLVGANLTDARLDGANLTDANLDGANLTDAKLVGASLVGANLDGASLVGAKLVGANLVGANLTDARLDGANLTDAKLVCASLYGANLDGASLYGANLDGASLVGAKLVGANLVGANLDGEILNKAPISLLNLHWPVLITSQYMRIGCQRHTHKEWGAFTDREIKSMAPGAISFWRKWKAPLLALCDINHEVLVATDPVGTESEEEKA